MLVKSWEAKQTSAHMMHVVPLEDFVTHEEKFTCVCLPKVANHLGADQFTVYWTVTHNSLNVENYKE